MKRQYLSLIIIHLIGFLCITTTANAQEAKRKRVAVVLSGGGVKGMAHIGVLKMIEETGIPVDMVVGTSMGAVVGGLYSIGYSPARLDSLVHAQDWNFVLSDRAPRKNLSLREREADENYLMKMSLTKTGVPQKDALIEGVNLENMLARLTVGHHEPESYHRLPIPFACVATNLSNGREVVMHNGILAQSIRASMSIPGVFSPIKIHDMTLVDGGLTNNFPADVARGMGADIIIGVTLQKEFDDTTRFNTPRDILDQVISIACRNKFDANIALSDLHFRIPASEYSTMDFRPAVIDTLLRMGYEYAAARRKSLDSLRHVIYAGTTPPDSIARPRISPTDSVSLHDVITQGLAPSETSTLLRTCRIKGKSKVAFSQIEEALRLLREKYNYIDASYRLAATEEGYNLCISAQQKTRSMVGVGARFDLEENAALLLGATLALPGRGQQRLQLKGKLGEQYSIWLGYSIEPSLYRQINTFYELKHHDIDVFENGQHRFTTKFQRHSFGVNYDNLRIRNFAGEAGAMISIFDYSDALQPDATEVVLPTGTDIYYSIYFRLRYNSQNRNHYATAGSRFEAAAVITTDNLSHYKRPHAFTSLSANWKTSISLSQKLVLEPDICGRTVIGGNTPFPYRNAYGNFYDGKYLEQQFACPGVSHLATARDFLSLMRLSLRYRIHGAHYVSLLGAGGMECNKISDIHRARYFYGIAARYGFLGKIGPIEGEFGYSSADTHLRFFAGVGFYF